MGTAAMPATTVVAAADSSAFAAPLLVDLVKEVGSSSPSNSITVPGREEENTSIGFPNSPRDTLRVSLESPSTSRQCEVVPETPSTMALTHQNRQQAAERSL